ncbi:hypothetical protein PE36_10733 [Moritella sp. PE36]|nr:hypothetical protein PE36_10733 [Moritella sp. PE36]
MVWLIAIAIGVVTALGASEAMISGEAEKLIATNVVTTKPTITPTLQAIKTGTILAFTCTNC